VAIAAGLTVVLAAGPLLLGNQYYLQILVNVGINIILVLGLNIITGVTGQLSLCQGAFFGIGAYASALLMMRAGLSFWVSLPLAALVAAVAGFVLGVPALRLRGHYLAMITLAFTVITHQVLQNWTDLTRGNSGLVGIPWPDVVGLGPVELAVRSRERYYLLVVALVVVAMLATAALQRSRLGRSLLAIREDEVAAELMGVDTRLCKLIGFSLSALLGGVAGSLYAHYAKILTPDLFGVLQSIDILVMLVIGGAGSIVGSALGAAVVTILPEALRTVADYRFFIFGAILTACILFFPGGLVEVSRRLVPRRRAGHRAGQPGAAGRVPAALHQGAHPGVPHAGQVLLAVQDVEKRFGGLAAVRGVTWDVRAGEILGLIGPNGSGKTTMLNLISGVYMPTGGTISLGGQPINGLRPSAISQAGISRTFQKIRLFRRLSVADNVTAALASRRAPGVAAGLWRGRVIGLDADATAEVAALLDLVGLLSRADDEARTLSYGEQRLLEIARALATRPRVLLLDEPAAGLSAVDVEALRRVLVRIRDSGIGVILVEHHMELVMHVSNRIVVLDHGEKIFDGAPQKAQKDPAVLEAYLGADADQPVTIDA
jgi:branched-chain amino acid transport system permease protein